MVAICYYSIDMKAKIHPNYIATKVTCAGCGTTFDSHSTVSEIHVDVCSNCHPFYTGKQKLVDTAGRVDRFKAKQAAAGAKKDALAKKGQKALSRAEAKAMLQADEQVSAKNTKGVKKDTKKDQSQKTDDK